MSISMNDIMTASLGEASSEIRAVFKKTVLVRQYETEVIEIETTVKMEKPMTGVERMLATAIIQAQIEYEAFIQLAIKGVIGQTQLNQRKKELEDTIKMLDAKAVGLLGHSMEHLIKNGDTTNLS